MMLDSRFLHEIGDFWPKISHSLHFGVNYRSIIHTVAMPKYGDFQFGCRDAACCVQADLIHQVLISSVSFMNEIRYRRQLTEPSLRLFLGGLIELTTNLVLRVREIPLSAKNASLGMT